MRLLCVAEVWWILVVAERQWRSQRGGVKRWRWVGKIVVESSACVYSHVHKQAYIIVDRLEYVHVYKTYGETWGSVTERRHMNDGI